MRSLRPLSPGLGRVSFIGAALDACNNSDKFNLWGDPDSGAPQFVDIVVPPDERWICGISWYSYLRGTNPPTYTVACGVLLEGATVFTPPAGSGGHPFKTLLSITSAGDALEMPGSAIAVLNPGSTRVRLRFTKDTNVPMDCGRRQIAVQPFMAVTL
jgi:hypothetical protein